MKKHRNIEWEEKSRRKTLKLNIVFINQPFVVYSLILNSLLIIITIIIITVCFCVSKHVFVCIECYESGQRTS